jgi:hypothetical protein
MPAKVDEALRKRVGDNLKYIRVEIERKTQIEFAGLFINPKTKKPFDRSNYQKYEDGFALAPTAIIKLLTERYNIPEDILLNKNISENPGLLEVGSLTKGTFISKLIQSKDAIIKEQQEQIEALQNEVMNLQNELNKKVA